MTTNASDSNQKDDRQKTIADFKQAVNMTAAQIGKWLASEDSRRVGQKHGNFEIDRQLTSQFDQAPVRHVAAGDQLPGQVDHVAHVEVCEVFIPDWRGQYFFHGGHSVTPWCEMMS